MREFWAKVDKNGPIHNHLGTRCWTWNGSAAFLIDDVPTPPQRVAWSLINGDPGTLHVVAYCGNPKCCNPAHLVTAKTAEHVPKTANGGRRSGAELKRTPPTTVRFSPENHAFVKTQASIHRDGQSGVINEAVDLLRQTVENKGSKKVAKSIGANGHGEA